MSNEMLSDGNRYKWNEADQVWDLADAAKTGALEKQTTEEDGKIEIDSVGKALADKFMSLSSDKQIEALNNIGLKKVKEPTPKEKFKELPKEEQEKFLKETNTEKMGFVQSAGKALTNIADRLETNIEKVMEDPGKRALFYAGLETVDRASRFSPIGQAQSPFGMIAGGFKEGVQKVKAEELAEANVAAKGKASDLATRLKLMEFQMKMDEPGVGEISLTKSLDKKLEGILSATTTVPLFGGMKRLVAERIKQGNFELPVGAIREKIPTTLQAINDLLPQGIKQGSEFFEKIENNAAFIGKFKKLNTDVVLDKISNTKLVPVSDKDVALVQQTVTQTANTPQVFLATLRSGDALNYLNAEKLAYGDIFKSERGYKRGSKRNFDEEFNTRGAQMIRDKLYGEYGEDKIREEANKLGFDEDYKKYADGQITYSPYALAEAKASLDMGGIDNYIKMQSGISLGGNTTTTITGTNIQVNPDSWKTKYPNIGKTQQGK
jgi:hypothetical protein